MDPEDVGPKRVHPMFFNLKKEQKAPVYVSNWSLKERQVISFEKE